MRRATHRVYKGWDVFFEYTAPLAWSARKEFPDGGHKLRAFTLAGIKALITAEEARKGV